MSDIDTPRMNAVFRKYTAKEPSFAETKELLDTGSQLERELTAMTDKWASEFALRGRETSLLERNIAKLLEKFATVTAERETLIARCSSCPNIIEAGTRLEKALVEVAKRDKVIATISSGGCPPENGPCKTSDCAECWDDWIKEQLK